MSQHDDLATLRRFLDFPLTETEGIFSLFATLPGARLLGDGRRRVLYVEGARPAESGRCLLTAHADTVWDHEWTGCGHLGTEDRPGRVEEDGMIRSTSPDYGIGADDRAGLAILWLLRESGHSLMVTDLEEHGRLGSRELREQHPGVLMEINRSHAFAIQFDRRNGRDYKCYDVGSEPFRDHVEEMTGFREPDLHSFTDINTLCDPEEGPAMCGVNLSVGYIGEHTPGETLLLRDWLNTLDVARKWLGLPLIPQFRRPGREK